MYNSSGLSLLVDLSPGQRFNIPRMTNPSAFLVHDGWLWFLTNGNPQSGNGNCLYRSNGTAAGTTPFVCDTSTLGLELFNDELYFSRSANYKGYELWKTDGTASGTVMVKDIYTGMNSGLVSLLTSTEDYLYFSAKTGTANTDTGLWRTDGTNAGTQLVKSGFVGYPSSDTRSVIGNVLYLRGTQYFSNSDSILGLWSTDGTTNGTTLYTNYDGQFPNPCWRCPQHQRKPVLPLLQRYSVHLRPDEQRCRGHHRPTLQLVDFTIAPCRPELWNQQRHDLGNADSVEHDHVVQHHGDQRQRQFNHEHQHHHQRSVAVAFHSITPENLTLTKGSGTIQAITDLPEPFECDVDGSGRSQFGRITAVGNQCHTT